MHDDTTCAFCRHRIYMREPDMQWDLVYKLYDGDTTICRTRGLENTLPHRPMGTTEVPADADLTPPLDPAMVPV